MNQIKNKDRKAEQAKSGRFFKRFGLNMELSRERFISSIPFILFLTFCAVIYIANRHYAEKTERQISRMSNEVKELRADYLTTEAELMFTSIQSEISKMVHDMGLKELNQPPEKLELD